jgi:transcriptional regulator with XRE-family HTH domain|tara:strand:+ start:1299 stop:1658 length:360 start_codon:yes stop_codon:yes gene_type:complete
MRKIILKLNTAERFLVSRRREKVSRDTYAKKHKLTVYRISKIEKGLSRSDKIDVLIQPRVHEVAFVLRKRAKLKVNQLAKLLKVSKQTILNREAGRRTPIPNIEFLIDYLKMEEIKSDK